jgi:catechol 2,3-dioxygenase-like lactoylglutathione lyase family enzyme
MKTVTRIFCLIAAALLPLQVGAIEVNKSASIKDTATTVLGINHIGLSVRDMDAVLPFYLQATGFELVRRETVSASKEADILYGHSGVVLEVAVLKSRTMVFELVEFSHNKDAELQRMPPQGPGMTHTCFQSPADDPAWDKFIEAGAAPLSRGGQPIDLGGYGVTYGYAYDPEGNMLEMEQLDAGLLASSGYDNTWQSLGVDMWMSQVGLATHDIERLMGFYQQVLGIQPYRTVDVSDRITFDEVTDIDNVHLKGGWFRLSEKSKVIEFWQYINPVTPEFTGVRDVTALGYSFSLEVADIQQEFDRLRALGVKFVGEPVALGGFWQVYAHDPDGNVFALRQAIDAESSLSVRQLENRG